MFCKQKNLKGRPKTFEQSFLVHFEGQWVTFGYFKVLHGASACFRLHYACVLRACALTHTELNKAKAFALLLS